MGQGKGVVASFWLVPENSGSWSFLQVGACKSGGRSLLLVGAREHTGSWSFLQVGACKLGGWSLLPVVAGEFREL
jgi:hypothetical protein